LNIRYPYAEFTVPSSFLILFQNEEAFEKSSAEFEPLK